MLKITETNVTIMVKDLNKAISFYEQIGFRLKQRWEDNYAMIETTGLTIGLHPGGETIEPYENISIGLMVEDADEAKQLLDKLKISYTFNDGKSGIYLHFTDLDGTVIYFSQPKWR